MNQATYNEHVANINSGKMVVIEGRSALSVDHLHFAIRASGDYLPTEKAEDKAPEDRDQDLNADGTVDDLEKSSFAELQATGEKLGLSIKPGTSKINAIAMIRAARSTSRPLDTIGPNHE